jgi:type IV secretory pathway TrbD component
MRIVKAGVLYFVVVFGTGFVIGPFRILWVAPRIGTRMAEFLESPIMFVITIVAARSIVRKLAVPSTLSSRLGMGGIGLGLMLIAEFTLVLWLRGLSIRDYIAGRDPVASMVYYAMLGVFAVLPILVVRK